MMKKLLFLAILAIAAHSGWSQKLVLAGKTAPVSMSLSDMTGVRTLDSSDPKISIQSFSVTFFLYGRPMEIACQGNTFTEEVYEGLELLNLYGVDPKTFTIEKVEAYKEQKRIEFAPLAIRLKS
ncbi:MAG: hypothetical protein JNM00_02565 [Flavobacteriales bacterium]|nr:hypothetical protein [Flavobacteriales bacterium]